MNNLPRQQFTPDTRVRGDPEVACSASGRKGSNCKSRVRIAVSCDSSYHPREVFMAQISLYVHKNGLKPHSLIY